MQRQHILKIFIKGFGFMLFGNILGGIMTISLAPFLDQWFIPYIAFLFSLFIYGSLLFTAGMNDGRTEAKLLRNKRIEFIPKKRWLAFGLILGAVMCVPCGVLMAGTLGALEITGEFLFAFRFLCGAVCPLFYIAGLSDPTLTVMDFPMWYHITNMALYMIITPVCAEIGYKFGYDEKSFADLMYENNK